MMKVSELGLYFRTLRHLRVGQVRNRIWRQVRQRTELPWPDVQPVPATNAPTPFIGKAQSIMGDDTYRFLNVVRKVHTPADWNATDATKLWLYHLHYHDGLLCENTSHELKRRFLTKWIEENPPVYANGWEPYPLSLRIVNWVKWLLQSNVTPGSIYESLSQQVWSLATQIEYHLLGNHLMANAKALVFAGCFFDGTEADVWFKQGISILKTEIPEQFLADGGHFELSTTYHATLTEDLLDIINILRTYSQPVPPVWEKAAQAAIKWQRTMTRPDGLPPLFNDAAYGISPSLDDIEAYAARLGLVPDSLELAGLSDLPNSGYFRFDGTNYSLFGDAGQIGPDYIPGHAHCDMLNFELFVAGQPHIVDVGTSTYEAGARRHYERSTAAHNTVQLEDQEQSEIWASFRVGRRAKIVERTVGPNFVIAAHNGFRRHITHRRKFQFSSTEIHLADEIIGANNLQKTIAYFHLHPDIEPRTEDGVVFAGSTKIKFQGAEKIRFLSYEYASEFNKTITAVCIEVVFGRALDTVFSL